MRMIQGSLFETECEHGEVLPVLDPPANVKEESGPKIAAAPELQSAIEKDTAELLEICEQWVRRYVILSEEQAVVLAAWILHTWTFEAAETTPYIHITAPERECGKSRLMETLAVLAFNPVRSGGMTAAALVRCIDAKGPTIFLDEMDTQLSGDKDYSETMRGILNEGFRKGGKFYKVGGRNHELRELNAYCPKCFAGIGKLPETVSSRSIAIEMRRKTNAEKVKPLRQREKETLSQPIRARLEGWKVRGVVRQLEVSRPAAIDCLGDRQNDICEPLLAIGEAARKDWLHRITSALVALLKTSLSENVSVGVRLLEDIRSIFTERRAEKIFSKELSAAEQNFRAALALDPSNVYANAMQGNWMLQNGGGMSEAIQHLDNAVSTGKARPFVRELQLGGLLYLEKKGARAELVKVATDMRNSGESINEAEKKRILGFCFDPVVTDHRELAESLSVVPPDEAWKTYLWLDGTLAYIPGESEVHDFIYANLLELSGKRPESLEKFRALQLKMKNQSGSMKESVNAAVARLSHS